MTGFPAHVDRPNGYWTFVAQLLRNPRQVSALAPSSQRLGRMMARQLPVSAARVAEFGAGLGNITAEILNVGIAPDELFAFELNPVFARHLRTALPAVRVVNAPAQEMDTCIPGKVDAVVSGLPLLSMPAGMQHDIVAAAFRGLRPDGVYIQFTYGPFPPLQQAVAQALGLAFTRTVRVWGNVPPATVYVYRRCRSQVSRPA
ncbi:MAG: SAM-dependent methyltransferase [Rhizobiaceae bacterium]|nr:SAM-dependent methyltransferase [Rhizobiaceae bacterium]